MSAFQHIKTELKRRFDVARAGPAPSAAATRPGRPVVAGLLSSASGLGRAARLTFAALREMELDPQGIDLTPLFRAHRSDVTFETARFEPDVPGPIVFQINPPEMAAALAGVGRSALEGRWRVGYWVWETPTAPASWRRAAPLVNAIWAPSTSAATALSDVLSRPVTRMLHPAAALPSAELGAGAEVRTRLLGGRDFLVGAAADARSSLRRKNPLGAIETFRAAFPSDPKAGLALHVTFLDAAPDAALALRKAAAEDDRIALLTDVFDEAEMAGFIAAPDVWLSLNRGEGFGLTLAERLLAGRPVIASAGSGPDDFLDLPGAHSVPTTLRGADDAEGPYRGADQAWREPDLGRAAELLRTLRDAPPPDAAAIAAAARARFSAAAFLAAADAEFRSQLSRP